MKYVLRFFLIASLSVFINCSSYIEVRDPLPIPNHSITKKKTLTVLYAGKPVEKVHNMGSFVSPEVQAMVDRKNMWLSVSSNKARIDTNTYVKYDEPLTPVVISGKKYNLRIKGGFSWQESGYLEKSTYTKLSDELMKSGLFSSIHYLDGGIVYGSFSSKSIEQGVVLKSNHVDKTKQIPVKYLVFNYKDRVSIADYSFDESLLQSIDTDYFLLIVPKDIYYSNFSDMNKEKPMEMPYFGCADAILGLPCVLTLGTIPGVDEKGGEMMYVLIEKNSNLVKNKYIAYKSKSITSNLLIPFAWKDNIAMRNSGILHREFINRTIINEMAVQIVEAVSAKENGR